MAAPQQVPPARRKKWFAARGGIEGASLRICRHAAVMFALLLSMPLLPLAEHPWMLLLGILPSALLFQWIVGDLLLVWRHLSSGRNAAGQEQDDDATHELSLEEVLDRASKAHDGKQPSNGIPDRAQASDDIFADIPQAQPRLTALSRPVPGAAAGPRALIGREPVHGLTLEVTSVAEGMVGLNMLADDGRTSARARVRVPLEAALAFGDGLRGFPGTAADQRDVKLGSIDSAQPGGGLRLVLFSRQGQTLAYVTVLPEAAGANDLRQLVSFSFTVTPKSLDGFARDLATTPLAGSRVVLVGA